jgi:hypothetical protein
LHGALARCIDLDQARPRGGKNNGAGDNPGEPSILEDTRNDDIDARYAQQQTLTSTSALDLTGVDLLRRSLFGPQSPVRDSARSAPVAQHA